MNIKKIIKDGIIDKNPIFVQLLGMCSTLAISTSVVNSLGMGLSVTLVLMASNLMISLLRKVIPSEIRIGAYIVIISGFVSAIQLLIKAFLPSIDKSLGVFIPLIVVNCIILARAESFASKNKPLPSLLDGLFMGIGYTLAITLVGFVRELFGNGSVFGFKVFGENYIPIGMVTHPAGAFIILGSLIALVAFLKGRGEDKKKKKKKSSKDPEVRSNG